MGARLGARVWDQTGAGDGLGGGQMSCPWGYTYLGYDTRQGRGFRHGKVPDMDGVLDMAGYQTWKGYQT